MIKCDRCGKKLKVAVMIVPPNHLIKLGLAKIENICQKCHKKGVVSHE